MKWISVQEQPLPTCSPSGEEFPEFLAVINNEYVVLMQYKTGFDHWVSCNLPAITGIEHHQAWNHDDYINHENIGLFAPLSKITHWMYLPELSSNKEK